MTIYKNLTITTKDKTFQGYIELDSKGIITSIQEGDTSKEGIDCTGKIAMPGFIDGHTHGGYGFNFDEIDQEIDFNKYQAFLKGLKKEGVVAFAGASVTGTLDKLKNITHNVEKLFLDNEKSKLVAWYYEGPFISQTKKGAHEKELIIDINENFLQEIKKDLPIPKIITVAPENRNNLSLIQKYQNDFIFALGHSNANDEIATKALSNGIKRITHLYNAMSGFHHHNLGILNTIFNKKFKKDLNIELIADGVHVDNEVIKYTYDNLDINNISIVSDSLAQKGLTDGVYNLGNLAIEKKGNWFYLENSNTLSGSACPFNVIVKNFYEATDCSLQEVVKISSYNCARNLNLADNYGDLIVGKKAHMIIIDKNFNVEKTI